MRFTHKLEKPEGNCNYFLIPDKEQCDAAENKLGQLEDIEDELGIDLITLFKALKNGVYIKVVDNLMEEYFGERVGAIIKRYVVNINQFYIQSCDFLTPGSFNVALKDYGKTWALTKEELL